MTVESCLAAMYTGAERPLALQEVDIPRPLEPGAVLCRVRLSTICGSDLHTISGRRTEPTPSILGHEIVGEILIVLGAGVHRNGFRCRALGWATG